jgi:hypothetical protein
VPDVPEFSRFDNDPLLDPLAPPADGSDLTRIATYLSSAETLTEYKDGFDFADVLQTVREVPGTRDAQMRWNAGAPTLRIEFSDDVDESNVTRAVVRLLREKMGLAAGPSVEEPTLDRPAPRPRMGVVASASVPTRPAPASALGRQISVTRDTPLPRPSGVDSGDPRVVVDHVQVTSLGTEATVEVRLLLSRSGKPVGSAVGTGQGPAVDAYLLRLAATSAASAVDQLLTAEGHSRGRCFIEHVTVVPFGVVEVAIVVLLLSYDGRTEQLAGSAIVSGDPRQAVVRATLAALNRRLESLLA